MEVESELEEEDISVSQCGLVGLRASGRKEGRRWLRSC